MKAMIAGSHAAAPKVAGLLAAFGIENPQPGQWYPQQIWLNAFKTIAETLGPNVLFLIGHNILEEAVFPADIRSIERNTFPHERAIEHALAAINVAFQMNHRGGEIGSYDFEVIGAQSGKMVCRNPYPSDFDRGIIQSVADRFKPKGSQTSVHRDYSASTRKSGGKSCTYLVGW